MQIFFVSLYVILKQSYYKHICLSQEQFLFQTNSSEANIINLIFIFASKFRTHIMNIFDEINKKCSQPHTAQLIQTLNKYRLQLTNEFTSNTELSKEKLIKMLLDLQMDIYENQYAFDLRKVDSENLVNLIKLFHTPAIEVKPTKKYDIDWSSLNENRKQKNQPLKKSSSSEQNLQNKVHNVPMVIKKGFFFQNQKHTQKQQKSKFLNSDYHRDVQKSQLQRNNQKNSAIQFISASVLPKAVSVRKKFVPPFKKQQSQVIMQENENQEDSKCQNPLYKGLQKKLVDIIECEILQTKKSVKWEEIAGLDFAKKLINQMIVWPMMRPDIFTGMRAPPRGILLFGPPGTGKTMIGRAIASSAHATFFNISASSLTSKWVGQSQKLVRTLFQIARIKQPSVIFIDEIDSLLCSRSEGQQQSSRRVKTQFLVELDGTKTNQTQRILIIGATNLPQQLDDAVRRRFIKRLYIPLPNKQSRFQLLQNLTNNPTFSMKKQDTMELAGLTQGFSGADVHALCKEASMMPLRQIHEIQKIRFSEVPTAKLKHFREAIKFVRPSVNKKVLAKYEDWNQQYGSYQFNPDQLQT